MVLEMILESLLDCKEFKLINLKGKQSWMFIGMTDSETEAPIFWPPDVKNWCTGKDPDDGKDLKLKEKGMTENEVVGWHHQLDGPEFEHALVVALELVTDTDAWYASVHGVAKSQIPLSYWTEIMFLATLKALHTTL